MGKGTPARGKRNKPIHMRCRRCGRHSYHKRKGYCSSCGYGRSKRIRNYQWAIRHKPKPTITA